AVSPASSRRSGFSASIRTRGACGSRPSTPASRWRRSVRTRASSSSRQRTWPSPPRRPRRSSKRSARSTPSGGSSAEPAMHWGLALRNFVGPRDTPDVDALYTYAERAEALGFESVWAWDHVILGVEPAFPILDAVGVLTALAARTRRIRLGTGVLVLPLRNPTLAAKALGTLDAISHGRLILGVAAGWYAREFDAVGVDFKQRGRLFEKNLEILTRLWTEDRVTLRSDDINLREAVMRPRPAQRPRPPILIGGYVDAVLRRVARMGDGWLTYFYTPERSEERRVGKECRLLCRSR